MMGKTKGYIKFLLAISLVLVLTSLVLSGCFKLTIQENQKEREKSNIILEDNDKETIQEYKIINEDGMTIISRYNPPKNFIRVNVEKDSFGEFLQNQKLKNYGEKVLYYDGRKKNSDGIYDSVLDVDIGDRNLHQCADAIMLLRAEYLYHFNLYDEIGFHFVNGFLANYKKWVEGYRIYVDGNNVEWIKSSDKSTDYKSFRKYMDMVFAYAGTISLDKELINVEINEIDIGDIFIVGGSPGHAIIVVDMAKNDKTKETAVLLAQSYMPAQQTQILINPKNKDISPWYIINSEDELVTPEWRFNKKDLKRFE